MRRWVRRELTRIKKGCIEFLKRKGEKLDLKNVDLSDLEVVSKQPKVVDQGAADIPLDDGPNEELGGPPEVKEKLLYVTRAIAARRRAGMYVESESYLPVPRSGGTR